MLIIDEDWSKADPGALKAAGYGGAVGYLSEDTTGKNLTASDVRALHAAGLAVGLVYEYATTSALGGSARGTRDAGIAVGGARSLNVPGGVCLYTAVDWQVTSGQMAAVLAYALAFQRTCAAAGYRAGIYGSYDVCAYLAQHGYTGLLWQTYAWSGGRWWPGAVVRQEQNGIHVAGATVDKDETMATDWGQWTVGGNVDEIQRTANNADQYGWGVVARHKDINVLDGSGNPITVHNDLDDLLQGIKDKLDVLAAPAVVDPVALAAALANVPGFPEAVGKAIGAELAARLVN